MSAFIIANIKVKDSRKFQQYAEQAGATFAEHGGQLVFRGKHHDNFLGKANGELIAVVKFASAEQASAWFHSDAYQACAEIRGEATDMTIDSYSVL